MIRILDIVILTKSLSLFSQLISEAIPAGILTMELAATEGLSRETEADVWDPFPCPKPAQMALCVVQVCKHTLTLPLLHFYVPPFFFDTRVLTSSDASSSQWPSGLAKINHIAKNTLCN
ncbi:hypothetical protein F4703DRAFT_1789797 [Phycomyces blakesleeanus]